MNQEDVKKKLDEAKDTAQNALFGIKARVKDMDKEKAKEALSGTKEKAKVALAEIKANFKADEGAEGVKKYQSMFKNLWKSGTTGKATLVAASIVVLLLFKSIFLGGGTSDVGDGFEASTSEDVDTLVIKGLYMRQSGDEALKACKKIASSSKDLVAIDFRNGIEREKDEATKAAEKKNWDDTIKKAEKDVDLFLTWLDENGHPFDVKKGCYEGDQKLLSLEFESGAAIKGWSTMAHDSMISLAELYGYQVEWMLPGVKKAGSKKLEKAIDVLPCKMGKLQVVSSNDPREYDKIKSELFKKNALVEVDKLLQYPWFRLVLKNTNGVEVAKEEVVKNWLSARGYRPPSNKMVIAKKNLIEIAIREDGKREDELKGICFVWINDEGKVKEAYFKEEGMARIFNAGDLSTDEFAEALVKNYQGDIPSLTTDVRTEAATDDLLASMKTRTWIYKDPRGYQVKLLERDFYDVVGQKVNLRADLALALALKADKTRDKYFTVFAIKPESEREFD